MDAHRKQLGLKDFLSESQDAVALQQIKERGALPMIDRVDISIVKSTVAGDLGLHSSGVYYGRLEHKADSLIAKFKRAERTEEIDGEQSRDYLRLWLSASSSACRNKLITVITPLPTKPSATKMPENWKLANAAITDMQMRQRDVAVDAKYTKELADAKAEKWCLRDDVAAGRRRLHIKAVCQSVREATTASGVDNAASPDWQTPLNGIISPQRGWLLCKNNWKEPRSILMSSVDRVAHIDGQLMQLLWAHTRASSGV